MELNREQIIKALECCGANDDCVGYKCPYYANCQFCITRISKDALSLIKELTEENERLRGEKEHNAGQEEYILSTVMVAPIADTVRKMQERINAHFDSDSDYFRSSHGYIRDVVDQIAKEMINNGEKEN